MENYRMVRVSACDVHAHGTPSRQNIPSPPQARPDPATQTIRYREKFRDGQTRQFFFRHTCKRACYTHTIRSAPFAHTGTHTHTSARYTTGGAVFTISSKYITKTTISWLPVLYGPPSIPHEHAQEAYCAVRPSSCTTAKVKE